MMVWGSAKKIACQTITLLDGLVFEWCFPYRRGICEVDGSWTECGHPLRFRLAISHRERDLHSEDMERRDGNSMLLNAGNFPFGSVNLASHRCTFTFIFST